MLWFKDKFKLNAELRTEFYNSPDEVRLKYAKKALERDEIYMVQ